MKIYKKTLLSIFSSFTILSANTHTIVNDEIYYPEIEVSPIIVEGNNKLSQTYGGPIRYLSGELSNEDNIRNEKVKVLTREFDDRFKYFDEVNIVIDDSYIQNKEISTNIKEGIYFDFNSYKLNQKSIEMLDKLKNTLNKYNDGTLKIEVYGFTDEIGNQDKNYKLSLLRASEVSQYLSSDRNGINAVNCPISVFAKGEIKSNVKTNSIREYNRRVEIKIKKVKKILNEVKEEININLEPKISIDVIDLPKELSDRVQPIEFIPINDPNSFEIIKKSEDNNETENNNRNKQEVENEEETKTFADDSVWAEDGWGEENSNNEIIETPYLKNENTIETNKSSSLNEKDSFEMLKRIERENINRKIRENQLINNYNKLVEQYNSLKTEQEKKDKREKERQVKEMIEEYKYRNTPEMFFSPDTDDKIDKYLSKKLNKKDWEIQLDDGKNYLYKDTINKRTMWEDY